MARERIDTRDWYAPRTLFDVALRGKAVVAHCLYCHHEAIFDPYALWWHFERRHWNDRLTAVPEKLCCKRCWKLRREKVRPAIFLSDVDTPDALLPRPSERDWKAAVRRART